MFYVLDPPTISPEVEWKMIRARQKLELDKKVDKIHKKRMKKYNKIKDRSFKDESKKEIA
jgi:hypothetical protein